MIDTTIYIVSTMYLSIYLGAGGRRQTGPRGQEQGSG